MALKILLADDNITAQKMGSKILTDAGYQVVAVSNGAAAMKKITSEKPELLILDVFMPGYTGLEVCEKVKSAAATATVPVLLTVTNMEPFNPEDGNKVKADGVMVKPFEASDLIAVIQKFEAKLHAPEPPPPPEPEYEKTQKMAAIGFQDASYEEWKAEAPPEEAEEPTQRLVMSREAGAAPALGMEDMLVEAPPPEPAAAPAAFTAESAGFETHAPESPAPFLDLEPAVAPAEAAPAIAPPPEVEFTSAPQVGAIEVAPAAELELNGHSAPAEEVAIVQDPALVTDPSDIAQFATKFGDAPSQPSFTDVEPPAAPAPALEEISAPPEVAPELVAFEAAVEEVPEAAPAPVAFEIPQEEPAAAVPEPVALEAAVEEAPEAAPAPVAFEIPQEEPAAAVPEPVAFEPSVEEPPAPVPTAVEELPPVAETSAASLEEEMRRAFDTGGGTAAAPALAPEPAPIAELEPVAEATPFQDAPPAPVVEPPPTPPPAAPAPDKLVEQFAAELAQLAPAEALAEVAPPEPVAEAAPSQAPVATADSEHVAEAVQRVMDRYKDELVAAIVRELKS